MESKANKVCEQSYQEHGVGPLTCHGDGARACNRCKHLDEEVFSHMGIGPLTWSKSKYMCSELKYMELHEVGSQGFDKTVLGFAHHVPTCPHMRCC